MSALSVEEGVGVGFQKEGDELKSASAAAEVGKHSPLPLASPERGTHPQCQRPHPLKP